MTHTQGNGPQQKSTSIFAHVGKLALVVAILAVAANLLILFGAKLGLWAPIKGFGYYRTYFNLIAFIAVGVGLAGLVLHLIRKERSGTVFSVIASLLGAIMLAPLVWATLDPPVRAPPIHDITTDTENPPEFLVLDDTRAGASNTLVYSGDETAAMQQAAYPLIAPIISDLTAADAFTRALSIAENMGWNVVSSTPDALRFEATARTKIFHFADDVVVVVTPLSDGSRIDMRSVSRVGRSDQGVNAKRILAFADAFNQ
ncbi:uncharacterized protein (DUF1499 family) [Loktanella ponticola]|uniref:Uncharacterized protein (DUF1499 family) n=1 Tax=Yoonia ponticola TaxID=1524255 RepID=A0A7W9BJA7_9RHOB|nr:DUF1499 domain-containing protein [Yoonia ponticola]MBB5721545.1 uncharacterized protein (DUF1499 family) [Yoonia ponticola]